MSYRSSNQLFINKADLIIFYSIAIIPSLEYSHNIKDLMTAILESIKPRSVRIFELEPVTHMTKSDLFDLD